MQELPRLTIALRTFGNVSQGVYVGAVNDLPLRKSLALEKQKERSLSWENLSAFIKKQAKASYSEIATALKQLLTTAKSIGEYKLYFY